MKMKRSCLLVMVRTAIAAVCNDTNELYACIEAAALATPADLSSSLQQSSGISEPSRRPAMTFAAALCHISKTRLRLVPLGPFTAG